MPPYLLAAYGIFCAVPLLYAIALWLQNRRAEREHQALADTLSAQNDVSND